MKRLEQFSVETPCQTGDETAIDTQIEVDLICGGVGFDDGDNDDRQWLIKARTMQKGNINKREA